MSGKAEKNSQRLALSIDSWKFLEDLSPVNGPAPEFPPVPEEISEEVENLKLRRALSSETRRRSEIFARLENIETHAVRFQAAVHALEEISDQLAHTRETLRKVGELSLQFPGSVRSEIVSLCVSAGVSVGPCIQVAGWSGLPRVRVFDEDLEISFDLCSEDGLLRGSALHQGTSFNHSEISLPIALLPSDATACLFKISDKHNNTNNKNNNVIAHTQRVDVDALFVATSPISVPLFRNNLPLTDAFLLLRTQGISDRDFLVRIRDLEIASHCPDPDSLTLEVSLPDHQPLKKFPLNRMHSRDVGRVQAGSSLTFRLLVSSTAALFASGSVLVSKDNPDCPLKDKHGNLAALVVLDLRDFPSINNQQQYATSY